MKRLPSPPLFSAVVVLLLAGAMAISSGGCLSDPAGIGPVCEGGDDCDDNGEVCAAHELDCDGECADPESDPEHCGDCFEACQFENAVARCDQGQCDIDECVEDYGNCDGDLATGCETDLSSTLEHCGQCGVDCDLPNVRSHRCAGGECDIEQCEDAWVNLDGDPATGCEAECPADIDVDAFPGIEEGGEPCELLGLALGRTYYVHEGHGDDANRGTMAQPFATIQHAVDAAADDMYRNQVYVAHGTYNESVELPAGVSMWGGFFVDGDRGVWQRDLSGKTAIVSDTTVGVRAVGHGGGTIGGFIIETADAAEGGDEMSTRAIILRDVEGFVIEDNSLYPGNGAAGSVGADGAEGVEGGEGDPGTAGVREGGAVCPEDDGLTPGLGGVPGTNPACPGTSGGAGGDSAIEDVSGDRGETGDSPDQNTPGGSYGERASYTELCVFTGDLEGGDGGNGSNAGSVGAGGDVPDDQAMGFLVGDDDWRAGHGLDGESGSPGAGGGGGGAGGHRYGRCENGFLIPDCNPLPAGGGGGGGAGGCGGEGGGGGQGGGHSIGLMLINADGVEVRNTHFVSGAGGDGGAGGAGGAGGSGGDGGKGGAGLDDAGDGGDGGDGGSGSMGSGGAGGAGGSSIGVFSYLSRVDASATSNTFSLQTAGQGGDGGAGAISGADGEDGGQHQIFVVD